MTTTDKVQVGDTTGTSTSTTWRTNPVPPPTEYGWACPRCNRINAPWVRQCDCGGNNYWTITSDWNYKPEWWKEVTCNNTDTFKIHPESVTYSNTLRNMQKELDEIKSTFTNTLRGE